MVAWVAGNWPRVCSARLAYMALRPLGSGDEQYQHHTLDIGRTPVWPGEAVGCARGFRRVEPMNLTANEATSYLKVFQACPRKRGAIFPSLDAHTLRRKT